MPKLTWVRAKSSGLWHILEADGKYACNKAIGKIGAFAKSRVGPAQAALPDAECCQNCVIKLIL
jgi:hypothetical protein